MDRQGYCGKVSGHIPPLTCDDAIHVLWTEETSRRVLSTPPFQVLTFIGLGGEGAEWQACQMKINHQIVVFDAADLDTESAFWAAVLDGKVATDEDWHMIVVDGDPRMAVQLAPDHEPPQWPDGASQQIHLDLWVDDIDAAHEEVMALGATLLKPAEETDEPDSFQVYADPAGHPFCLCWITG